MINILAYILEVAFCNISPDTNCLLTEILVVFFTSYSRCLGLYVKLVYDQEINKNTFVAYKGVFIFLFISYDIAQQDAPIKN
jgi:hypothetical protein